MSELAFNVHGENFEIPSVVTGWRVRRLKPRGAPELVYGRDGRPLTIPIESDIVDLREAVGGIVGRYRLDPLNDDGKQVESAPAAYIQVVKAEQPAESQAMVVHTEDDVVREAMRPNTELAKAIVERFPEMMQAAAELLRAADGAGMPSRQPTVAETVVEDPPLGNGFDLGGLVAQLAPVLMSALNKGKLPAPIETKSLEPTKEPALPSIDPATMAHFVAVQSALTPQEAKLAREVAKELSPAELRGWFDELKKLSVADAVEKVRALTARRE
jgi:hypothetical protein